jgi:superfamily I DNA and/or RNA helicase
MHPEICAFPSNFFYNGKLVDSDTVLSYVPVYDTDFSLVAPDPSAARAASQLLSQLTPPGFLLRMKPKTPAEPSFASFSTVDGTSRGKHTSLTSGDSSFSVSYYLERNSSIFLRSIEFINVTTSVEENDSHNRKTLINRQEAVVVIALLQFLTRHFRGISIGIITPYEGQKRFIRNLIMDLPSAARECIEINTVDGFQGREKDVVIISCVRTSRSNIGFLSDERRMNVAITRARRSLIILGSTEALATNDASWAAFIDHVKRKNGLSSVSLTPLS